MVSEIGYPTVKIEYTQNRRERGITKNNFYTLYDIAMLGITSHSKVPLRLATMLGFAMSAVSLLVAVGYFIYKLVFWNNFSGRHCTVGNRHFFLFGRAVVFYRHPWRVHRLYSHPGLAQAAGVRKGTDQLR